VRTAKLFHDEAGESISERGGAGGDEDVDAHNAASVVVGGVELDAGVGAVEKTKYQKADARQQDGNDDKRMTAEKRRYLQRRHAQRHHHQEVFVGDVLSPASHKQRPAQRTHPKDGHEKAVGGLVARQHIFRQNRKDDAVIHGKSAYHQHYQESREYVPVFDGVLKSFFDAMENLPLKSIRIGLFIDFNQRDAVQNGDETQSVQQETDCRADVFHHNAGDDGSDDACQVERSGV